MPDTISIRPRAELGARVWEKGVFVRPAGPFLVDTAILILCFLFLVMTTACGGLPPTIDSPAPAPASSSTAAASTSGTSNTNTASATSNATTTASVPTSSVEHRASLSWVASPAFVDGYIVYRSLQPGGPYGSVTPAAIFLTSFVDDQVSAGQTYFYVVTAVANGVESAYSNEVEAKIPSP